MPAAVEVVREYPSDYSFVFNLDIALLVLEGASDGTVGDLSGGNVVRASGLDHAATARAKEGT
jgi:hypothetical protein